MAFGHGKNAKFLLANVAGSTIDISQYIQKVNFSNMRDEVDVTTLGAVYRAFLSGIIDGSFDLEGIWDPTLHNQMFALGTANTAYFEYAPQGTATGNVKLSGSANRLQYDYPTDFNAAVTWKAQFHISGTVTNSTY